VTTRPLLELDPAWLILDGRRVGFMFRSPKDPAWHQIVLAEPIDQRREQWRLAAEAVPDSKSQTAGPGVVWTFEGGIDAGDFSTLTVFPSVDGSAGGLWHGWIQNGEARDA
jgi:hypothetical protein